MVIFKDKSFTIQVKTASNPIEDWIEMHNELCDLLQNTNPDMMVGRNYFWVYQLLREMMPDITTVRKMIK